MPIISKIEDAAWGFITGDALGVPYEFKERQQMRSKPCTDMEGYGTHFQPKGTWSDDSAMMLCVLENIQAGGDIHSLARLFSKWYRKGHNSAHDEVFDIGINTRLSLERILSGIHPMHSGINEDYSQGNGSLMRCLPYAFIDDFHKGIFQMVLQNRITHPSGLCNLCCMFYCKMIRSLSEEKDQTVSYAAAKAYLRYGWRITDENRETDENKEQFKMLFSENFPDLNEYDIISSGYVIRTLEAAVWCFLNTGSYREAVLKAVNLGGDTDTIAALTGGLAAVYYGKESIPKEWLTSIANKERIIQLLSINPNLEK